MSEATGDSMPMEGYLLLFDGPAQEQRIEMSVPPSPVRWFCRSGELGSDEFTEWWVTAEQPPEDESIEITEYRLDVTVEPEVDEETGALVIRFSCDSEHWFQANMMGRPLPEGTTAMDPNDEAIPRASFHVEDISAVFTYGEWVAVQPPAKMSELVVEPGEGKAKVSIGPNIIWKDGDEYVAIAPTTVSGFRFRPSSIAREPEAQADTGVVRIARDTYDASDAEVTEIVANAERVFVIEPDGTHTPIKTREG